MTKLEDFYRIAIVFIGIVVLLAVMDLAEEILAPVTLALTAGVVLSPLSDAWEKLGFPSVYGAITSLFVTLAALAAFTALLYPVVAQLVDLAPKVWIDVQEVVHILRGMLQGMAEITEDVSKAIVPEAKADTAQAPAQGDVAIPTIGDAILLAPSLAAQFLVFVGALFFFLLTRREIYDWIAGKLVPPTERATTARRLREAERKVAAYFGTVTAINAVLGVATAVVMQFLGLPGALLWGLLAFVLNYVLYLGPAAVVLSLLFAGIAAFDGPMAAAPAVSFAMLNALEGQFMTPALVGRYLSVNPHTVRISTPASPLPMPP